MKHVLAAEGVPEASIWTERQSRNTYENARYSAEILRARGASRVVLVTEAYHMLRAARSFQRQGIQVIPAPCGYRYVPFRMSLERLLPNSSALATNEAVLHEWIGLGWYKIKGRI
jgi:uncharacterized SAM-binding protein YcdF (DUF218 family)